MPKKNLTDRTLKALNPANLGVRYEIIDTEVPSFGVRVTDKGQRSFILIARYPGSKHPARRTLGEYPELSLQAARDKARAWREMIRRGIDPREKDEERRRAERERRTNTFGAVAEDFIKRHLKDQRRAVRSEREIRKELIARWIDKPVTDITRREVVDMVNEILERGAKRQAHNI